MVLLKILKRSKTKANNKIQLGKVFPNYLQFQVIATNKIIQYLNKES
jgi:hypothetical protein